MAVFQPHTFSRTQAFLDEFATSLSKADHVYLCEIFGSIRENTGDLTIQDLINRIDGSALIEENNIDVLDHLIMQSSYSWVLVTFKSYNVHMKNMSA